MAGSPHPKLQHYVPRFLLRNFGVGKKEHIHVFDKWDDRVFNTKSRNVAAENAFYDFEYQGVTITAENALSSIESAASRIFRDVLRAESLAILTAETRMALSHFLAMQMVRTRAFRNMTEGLASHIAEKLGATDVSDDEREKIKQALGSTDDDNFHRMQHAISMKNALENYPSLFYEKSWVLLRSLSKNPFCIGDNPLALQNANDFGPYGNLGLAVRGIEIYLPLTPVFALGLWCPSIEHSMRDIANQIAVLKRSGRPLPDLDRIDPDYYKQIVQSFDEGVPLQYTDDNCINFNSLQVYGAARYVFSSTGDFSLARKMIERDQNVRSGPKFTSS